MDSHPREACSSAGKKGRVLNPAFLAILLIQLSERNPLQDAL
jgi:hypothetical protein